MTRPIVAAMLLAVAAAPNPFNPVTMLRVELPTAGNVAVTIHDLRGRRVRALMTDGNHPAGTLTVPWDGRDDRRGSGRGQAGAGEMTAIDGHEIDTIREDPACLPPLVPR